MELIDMYSLYGGDILAYLLLSERDPRANISHKRMPTWGEHTRFISSRPYPHWYAIYDSDEYVGAIYLTDRREIGIQLFSDCQGKGYGRWAVEEILRRHPGPAYANVAPENEGSHNFFRKMGGRIIQVTYALEGVE